MRTHLPMSWLPSTLAKNGGYLPLLKLAQSANTFFKAKSGTSCRRTASGGTSTMCGAIIARIVRNIPSGRVVTYGDNSTAVYGRPNCGQAVGAAIRREASEDWDGFPWWRVVFSGLKPKDDCARRRLESEGVRFLSNGSIHPEHRYEPPRNCQSDNECRSGTTVPASDPGN